MESLSPNVFVNNITEAINFYKLLGFEVVTSVPEQGDFVWVMMSCNKVTIMFQTFESLGDDLPTIKRQHGGSLLLYINLKNISEFFNRINDHVAILKGLEKTFYGATEFSIRDNNNYILTFAEHEQHDSQ